MIADDEAAWLALGFDPHWQALLRREGIDRSRLGRVCAEHRGQWVVGTAAGDVTATTTGRLRSAAKSGEGDLPTVGDWVAFRASDDGAALQRIERVLERRTRIVRKAAGRVAREQLLAANVDVAFILCALGRDVNERRIERFTTILWAGGVEPVVLLTKADLVDDATPFVERAVLAAPGAPVHVVSAVSGAGLPVLDTYLKPGRTLAVVGTSGAGKSTLVNRWVGAAAQRTLEVGSEAKGRHTTVARQLFALPSGALVLDTPGLREVGLWDGSDGLSKAFEEVDAVARACRFTDCRHDREPGCAVSAALKRGELSSDRVTAWRQLTREQERVGSAAGAPPPARRRSSDKHNARARRERTGSSE